LPPSFAPTARFPAGLLPERLDAGDVIVRVHREGQGAIFFGPETGRPSQNRFDAPNGEYRVLYAAERLEGAFVETVLRQPAHRIVRRAFIDERMWSPLRLNRAMILAKIMDEGLLFHGVDASVSSSDNYGPSRTLALQLYQDFPDLDGLAYRSRHNNGEVCYVFFDRVLSTDFTQMAGQCFRDHRKRTEDLVRLHGAVLDTSPDV
jgi:hypothetical protein